jgi:ABC-type glycerol-3-phosphate transport system substrate-binding protein
MILHAYLRRVLPVLVAGAVVLGLAACSGDDGRAASGAATTTAANAEKPGTAQVSTFDVPTSAECGGKTSTTVDVTYATTGAKKQELYVDGRIVSGTDVASGTVTAPVHCDPLPHTFVMVAYDANGRRTPVEKKLTTNA